MGGAMEDRTKSLRTQLSGQQNNRGGRKSAADELKDYVLFCLREVPVDSVVTLCPLSLATVLYYYPHAVLVLSPLTMGLFDLGLAACCGIPLSYSLTRCEPSFVLTSLLLLFVVFPKQADGTVFASPSDGSLLDYAKTMSVFAFIVCYVGVFIFSVPFFAFRKRLSIWVVVALSAWTASTTCVMGVGIMMFQWFFLAPGLSIIEEIMFIGIIYPLFGATVGRILYSDIFATLTALLVCDDTTIQLWDSSQAVHARMLWITMNRVMLGFAGTISLINMEYNSSFGISLLSMNMIEIFFTHAWFYASANIIPKLLTDLKGNRTKVAPTGTDQPIEKALDTNESTQESKLVVPNNLVGLLAMWLKLFVHKENLPMRFALTRAYEERAERLMTLAAMMVLLVCGSHNIEPTMVIARAFFVYFFEIFVVDPIKLLIQYRVLNLFPLRRTHTFHEHFVLCASLSVSVALLFISRLYCNEHNLPISII